MANKIMRFVMQPLNHVFLGLGLVAVAQVLPQVFSSANWSYAGYVFTGIGSVWLVVKALR